MDTLSNCQVTLIGLRRLPPLNGSKKALKSVASRTADNIELLADGVANGQRDRDGRFLPIGPEVEMTFVNRSLLDIRREVATISQSAFENRIKLEPCG